MIPYGTLLKKIHRLIILIINCHIKTDILLCTIAAKRQFLERAILVHLQITIQVMNFTCLIK